MIVAFVRHGRTEWNDAGRMQGRADIGLSEAGRAQVRGWTLPRSLAGARFVASPLARARETAAIMGKTIDNVKVLQNRAIAALRKSMEHKGTRKRVSSPRIRKLSKALGI